MSDVGAMDCIDDRIEVTQHLRSPQGQVRERASI